MNKYDDALPVDDEWVDEHIGEEWTFTLILSLYDLIETGDIDGLNKLCDGITGVVLTNLSYRIGTPDYEDQMDNTTTILIEATGTVEEN